uniref:influenza virus NS1A-binding protein-like n=1 Tax=Styela clava TaxID=7725 RepID=UPI0019399DAF|nr:influenza virus NS1A-binding protein-like [Styela clava]
MADHQCHHGQYLRTAVCNGFIYLCDNETLAGYNIRKNIWRVIKSEKVMLKFCALVGLQESIYVLGGYFEGRSLSSVNRYSQVSLWSAIKAMNVARQVPAATAYGNRIFVAGGFDNGSLASSEFYDPLIDSWTNLASMTVPRYSFCLSTACSELFAIGGKEDRTRSIEKYNFESSRWEHLLNFPRNMNIARVASLAFKLPQ